MSFHSLEYLLFLPLAVAAYFLTPWRLRWAVIVAASVIFYASWRLDYIVLLLFSTLVDYTVALAMPRAGRRMRNVLLGISLTANLGILIGFKFFADIANSLFASTFRPDEGGLTPMLFLLPLGISFYTFQTLSYTIDVWRGKREPERHLGYFAAYVMFFPQLIAGPIERFGKLMPQLRREQIFDWSSAAAGGGMILIGLYKKLVLADGLAPWIATSMERAGGQFAAGDVYMLGVANAYRYYCDLSGYADIAIGSALLFGIRLTPNFRRPFAAGSINTLWQRWHITISWWFRDYFYAPLVRRFETVPFIRPLGILATMGVIGIWHGATWNWLTIGFASGVLMSVSNNIRKRLTRGRRYPALLKRAFDAAELVLLWIFIPIMGVLVLIPDPAPAWAMAGELARAPADLAAGSLRTIAMPATYLLVAIAAIEIFKWFDARSPVHEALVARGRTVAFAFYLGLIAVLIVMGTYGNPDFLYFQF